MPEYVMSRGGMIYHDPHDRYWLAYRLKDALDPHTTKIFSNFQQNAGGWEGWAQFELMHAFTLLAQSAGETALRTGLFNFVWTEFLREEAYKPPSDDNRLPEPFRNWAPVDATRTTWTKLPEPKPKGQRADFTIRVETDNELSESHYVELKCRSSKESSAAFVARVKEDIEKVLRTQWSEWLTTESASSAWVVAISISAMGELDGLMHNAAREMGIEWHVIPLAEFVNANSEIKLWCYTEPVKGFDRQLLLGYASEFSLKSVVQDGVDTRTRLEPDYDEYLY